MSSIEMINKYPLSISLLKEWIIEKLLDSAKDEDIPEDFKQHMIDAAVSENKLAMMMDVNPHALFEFFDKNKIFITIAYLASGTFGCDIDLKWGTLSILDNDDINYLPYENRLLAEKGAMEKAFELLEEILCEK